jgi:hypothetical protein
LDKVKKEGKVKLTLSQTAAVVSATKPGASAALSRVLVVVSSCKIFPK